MFFMKEKCEPTKLYCPVRNAFVQIFSSFFYTNNEFWLFYENFKYIIKSQSSFRRYFNALSHGRQLF